MMDRVLPTSFDPTHLVSEWFSRLQEYRVLLKFDPGNDIAERWRIRIKVLEYLLARYGSDPTLRSAHLPASDFCWIEPFHQQSVPNGTRTRTRIEFREILDRIAAAKAS